MKYTALGVVFIVLLAIGGAGVEAATTSFDRDLKQGDTGEDVGHLQEVLLRNGLYFGPVTGYFGPQTQDAVELLHMRIGYGSVGVVSPETRAFLSVLQQLPFAITWGKGIPMAPEVQQKDYVLVENTEDEETRVPIEEQKGPVVPLPYKAAPFSGWERMWGSMEAASPDALVIASTASTTGASAVFTSSLEWVNYQLVVDALIYQGSITLYGRYIDDKNFAACIFAGNHVRALQRVAGVTTSLGRESVRHTGRGPYHMFFMTSTTLKMTVKGDRVGCTLIGPNEDVTATLDASLTHGGIGVETWHEVPGVAKVKLLGVEVRPM